MPGAGRAFGVGDDCWVDVRRLDALEALSTVRQVFFDKTGTLTESELSVVSLPTASGAHDPRHALVGLAAASWQTAASLAAQSHHHPHGHA